MASAAALENADALDALAIPFWSEILSAADPGFSGVNIRLLHPFFDVRLIDFLAAVPAVPWRIDKALLRRAMAGLLPDSVLRRPKSTLKADPFQVAAVAGMDPWYPRLAASPTLDGYVDREKLLAAAREPSSVRVGEFVRRVVQPASLAMWLERRGRAARPRPEASPNLAAGVAE